MARTGTTAIQPAHNSGGQLDTELFAFVNIFATNPNAKIESLLFEQDQGSQGEFETDNHTVCADILNPDTGTPILQTGSITIVKEANPESEQEFDFLTNIGGPNSAFTLKDNGIDDNFIVFDDLPPFLYDVSEQPTAGWVFDEVVCTGGADIRIVGADVQIALSGGEDVTCTYTNEAVFDLTIVKEAVGGDDTFEFEKTVNSDIDFADFSLTTQGGAAQTTLTDLPAGFLQIEEIVPPGWKLTDIECVGVTDDDWASNSPRASLTASPGDDITCTFTNEKLGTINIVKQTAPANGVDFGFTDDIESPNSFSLDDGQTKTFLDVVPGQYTVTEDDPGVGTFLSGLVCDDANSATPSRSILARAKPMINLDPGETVTCTYTNTAEDFIVIAKLTDPAGGAGFDFTSPLGNFTLNDGEIEIFEVAQPGTFTFTEEDPGPDYALSFVECAILKPEQDPIFVFGDLGTRSVDVTLDGPGQAAFCFFGNSLTNACPVDPNVGNELTDLIGTGMGSPTRQRMMAKITVPNAGDVVELYAQMAAKEYTAVRYVRFIFGDKTYVQVQPETDLGAKAAISWWGEDLTSEFQSQAKPFVKGRWFLNKGMRKMKAPRAYVLYPTYQTADEYANAWSTFGAPTNFVAGTPGFDQTNTNTLAIPELQVATDVTVELAVTDVNRDPRTVDVMVSAGGVSETVTLTGPTNRKSELLNIFTVTLENVPAGTDEVEITLESVLGSGDSAALLGAAANYQCDIR